MGGQTDPVSGIQAGLRAHWNQGLGSPPNTLAAGFSVLLLQISQLLLKLVVEGNMAAPQLPSWY